jgi:hypothetical protein
MPLLANLFNIGDSFKETRISADNSFFLSPSFFLNLEERKCCNFLGALDTLSEASEKEKLDKNVPVLSFFLLVGGEDGVDSFDIEIPYVDVLGEEGAGSSLKVTVCGSFTMGEGFGAGTNSFDGDF